MTVNNAVSTITAKGLVCIAMLLSAIFEANAVSEEISSEEVSVKGEDKNKCFKDLDRFQLFDIDYYIPKHYQELARQQKDDRGGVVLARYSNDKYNPDDFKDNLISLVRYKVVKRGKDYNLDSEFDKLTQEWVLQGLAREWIFEGRSVDLDIKRAIHINTEPFDVEPNLDGKYGFTSTLSKLEDEKRIGQGTMLLMVFYHETEDKLVTITQISPVNKGMNDPYFDMGVEDFNSFLELYELGTYNVCAGDVS